MTGTSPVIPLARAASTGSIAVRLELASAASSACGVFVRFFMGSSPLGFTHC
jgi:hypothetical protein